MRTSHSMYCIGRSVPFFLPPFRCNSRLRFVAHVSRSCRKNALVHTHPPPSFERFASLSRSFVQLHYGRNCNYTTDGKTALRYVTSPVPPLSTFALLTSPRLIILDLHNFRCIISKPPQPLPCFSR